MDLIPDLSTSLNLEKSRTNPILGVLLTIVRMYHFAMFGVDPMNSVQNFPSKPKKTQNMAIFFNFQKFTKSEQILHRPNFWFLDKYCPDLNF